MIRTESTFMKFLLVDIFAILNSTKFQHRKIHNDGDIFMAYLKLDIKPKSFNTFLLSLESSDLRYHWFSKLTELFSLH
jgi:hypothetical protein